MFASECLDSKLAFDAAAPAIAMAAAFATFLFDFVGARGSGGGSAGHGHAAHVHGVVGGGGEAVIASETASAEGEDMEKGARAIPPHDTANIPMCSHSQNHLTADGWQVILLEAGIIFHS